MHLQPHGSAAASALKKIKQIGHHARPRRAPATAPLRTGADTCKTGSGAGKRSGAKSDPVRRRSNHACTEDQAGRRKRDNIDVVGGWRVHTADDTPSRNSAALTESCVATGLQTAAARCLLPMVVYTSVHRGPRGRSEQSCGCPSAGYCAVSNTCYTLMSNTAAAVSGAAQDRADFRGTSLRSAGWMHRQC